MDSFYKFTWTRGLKLLGLPIDSSTYFSVNPSTQLSSEETYNQTLVQKVLITYTLSLVLLSTLSSTLFTVYVFGSPPYSFNKTNLPTEPHTDRELSDYNSLFRLFNLSVVTWRTFDPSLNAKLYVYPLMLY